MIHNDNKQLILFAIIMMLFYYAILHVTGLLGTGSTFFFASLLGVLLPLFLFVFLEDGVIFIFKAESEVSILALYVSLLLGGGLIVPRVSGSGEGSPPTCQESLSCISVIRN